MAERATVFQTVQVGVESTYGTSVAASKLLQSMSIEPNIQADVKTFRPSGQKFNTVAALGKEWSAGKLSGMATYTEIIYALASALKKPTPTTPGGTTPRLWTFDSAPSAADTIASYTVEQGSAERAHKVTGLVIPEFGMDFSRDAVSINGSTLARAVTDGITLTAAPTAIALLPILPTAVSVKLADTQAGLAGASVLSRALSASWNIGNRFGPLWTLDSTQTSFAALVEMVPSGGAKLKVEADAAGMGLLTQLRSGATKFMRIAATGDQIETTYYYSIQIDLALKVTKVSDFSDADGVYAVEWEFELAKDSTWGKAIEVQVQNIATAL